MIWDYALDTDDVAGRPALDWPPRRGNHGVHRRPALFIDPDAMELARSSTDARA
ncbi:hypothetical protein SEA_HANNACONDA_81 [Mycobacterium phage Hannaconda]|nr:hypothetical protein SEA_DMPSTRDIVER_95 [Mycobacterium phage DmpstrDiver]QGJ93722.1 hypothetical protein SEA_HANNACONDA_81 [Mycobacterium phage Hannaconda]QPO16692.1 hypothetical protein SEA_KASHFLOW_84 [Mycobacterium phage KashFlow]